MQSIYSEEEIRQASEVLEYLKEHKGFNFGNRPHPEGSGCMQRRFLNNVMCDDLGLVRHTGDIYSLTALGREAAEMGFSAWLQEQERKAKEPVPTKEVKDTYERRMERWQAWCGIIGGIIAIIDLVLRILGIL